MSGAGGRTLERIVRACRDVTDSRRLRLEVIAELRRVLDVDAYAWVLTDPATCVGVAPVADVPWLAELPLQIRLKYLTAVNRWTALPGRPVALLREATRGDLSRSLVWDGLLRRYGVDDAASVVFRDRYGCWAFLELWSRGRGGGFGPAATALLTELAGPLTAALRRCQAATFAEPGRERAPIGPVVLLLSPQLQVRGQTPAAADHLRVLVPPDGRRPPVPAAAYNVAAQLLAAEAGVDAHPPSARVHLTGARWVTAHAARIEGPLPRPERDIAVTIEETPPGQRVDLFARACGLSERERQILERLAAGDDTAEIARRLILSANTVQDHLKSVFDKTAVRSRRALLARALGR